ncbi:MAG TPA: hypothetical protein VHD32_09590 [Candidatus Didemnitutus sp.]|nr:hypothetical protein [Candidatus Didemnitutus sp.]
MPRKSPHDLRTLQARSADLGREFAATARRTGRKPWTREEIAQGFVVDVGDLMRLVMAKAGRREVKDVDRKLGHELADCLWSILVLADAYGVDLEKEFDRMVAEVGRKLARSRFKRRG